MLDNKSAQQKAEEKLAGDFAKFVVSMLLERSKNSRDPEFKKTIAGLSSYGGEYLWRQHGDHVKKHLSSIYRDLIHPSHGGLHHEYERHTYSAAKNATDDIWNSYYNH